MDKLIERFFNKIRNNEVEIYNEFSFQHELGIFLRKNIPNMKVQFERNISYFKMNKAFFEKKEIDIAIFSEESLEYVIEVKYPRNGQVPESIYSFCKDIVFLEQLAESGFKSAYFIAVADDHLFYSGNSKGIYGLFRAQNEITGIVQKPTGAKDTSVNIKGSYIANWKSIKNQSKYCAIKVHS